MTDLPERPLLRRHLLARSLNGQDVFVLAEDRQWLWKSRPLADLLPLLDGEHDLGELFAATAGALSPPELLYLLGQLQAQQLLADAAQPGVAALAPAARMFRDALGAPAAPVGGARGAARVSLAAAGCDSTPLRLALEQAGVRTTSLAAPAELHVLAVDHYFRPELAQHNRLALASGGAWMACKLVGTTAWIGPLSRPGRTACISCLQSRLRLNRQVEDYVVRHTGEPTHYETSTAALPATHQLAAAWAAFEIAAWLDGSPQRLEGQLLSIDFGIAGIETAHHVVTRLPQCPVCGAARASPPSEPTSPVDALRSRPAVFATDAGLRVESAQDTLARLQRHVSPITGVVTSLTELAPDPEHLLHCYSAAHHFTLGPDTPYWLRQSLRSRTGGKGVTDAQARASALCEAIERFCGVFHADVPTTRAPWCDVRQRAVHPTRCMNFSDAQYAGREASNADRAAGYLNLVPNRFSETTTIDWVQAWPLAGGAARLLPASLCWFGHPDAQTHFFCSGDARGCAAGNTLEEATLQALLELVERDAAALWWYNRLRRPPVDLDAVPDAFVQAVRERLVRQGRAMWVLDITSDLGIPTFAAVSRRIGGPTQDLLLGLAAHLDPALALLRAVTEMVQFLPAVARQDAAGNTLYAWPDEGAKHFWATATLASQPQLAADASQPARRLADIADRSSRDLLHDVQACVRSLAQAGLEPLLIDQTRPDIDLHVVRVVVPELRHFWRRLGPGRLYDVPVKMGWLAQATAETDMNLGSIFF